MLARRRLLQKRATLLDRHGLDGDHDHVAERIRALNNAFRRTFVGSGHGLCWSLA
jgi:hypothetical protein